MAVLIGLNPSEQKDMTEE